jgi:preprotein translocase subunit SecE
VICPQDRQLENRHRAVIAKTKNFFNEVKVELQKASWPWDPKEKGIRRYKELVDSTLVVIIAMVLLGGYVALFDFVLVNAIHYFTRLH